MPFETPAHHSSQGAGVLVQSEVERIELGAHRGQRVAAYVEHRVLRVGLGRRWAGAVTLGRRRPLRVEMTSLASDGESDARRYDVSIGRPPDPWLRFARRVAVVAGLCWVVTALAGRWARVGGSRGGTR